MIDHITIRVKNFENGKEFYKKALKPLGYEMTEDEICLEHKMAGFCCGNRADVWIKEDTEVHGFSCLAFGASSTKMVDDFYKAAVEAGGTGNGEPCYNPEYHAGYYAGFVVDPDGHNIEAVFDDYVKAGFTWLSRPE